MIRILTLTLMVALSNVRVFGQDPIFSQFYAAPLQINPAFTGNSHGGFISLNYRNQWPSMDRAYVTYAASYDQYIDALNSGFGLYVSADDAGRGILKTYNFSGFYSYRVRLGKDLYARMGIEAGFINPTLDWDKLIFLDQLDPEYGLVSPGGTIIPTTEQRPENISKHVFDASMGIMIYSSQYYGGISIKHLNSPDLGFFNEPQNAQQRGLPMRITLHAGAEFPIGGKPLRGQNADFFWSPSILFVKQGPFYQLNGGAIVNYKQVFGGLFYRHAGSNGDAIVFNLGTRFDKYRIGYSYDFTVSRLYNASGGSHEISFGVLLNPDSEKVNISDCFQLYR